MVKYLIPWVQDIPLFGAWYSFSKTNKKHIFDLEFNYTKDIRRSYCEDVLLLETSDDYLKFTYVFITIILGGWDKVTEFYSGIEFRNVKKVAKELDYHEACDWIKSLEKIGDCGCYTDKTY